MVDQPAERLVEGEGAGSEIHGTLPEALVQGAGGEVRPDQGGGGEQHEPPGGLDLYEAQYRA